MQAGIRPNCTHILALLLTGCVILGELLDLSEPQFPDFYNVAEDSAYFIIIL